MKLNLFTPERVLLENKECRELIVPSVKGYLGILPQHAPLISLLKAGVLKYLPKNSSQWESLALGWGYLEVYQGGVRILAESAETKESLDRDKVKKELKQILLELEKVTLEPFERKSGRNKNFFLKAGWSFKETMEIFVNVRPYQTRVACVEKGRLQQIFYHRDKSPSQVGALYKGRVIKINKGLNFAFVDLGLERSGFLYGKDLAGKNKEVSKALKLNQEIMVQIRTDPIRKKGVRLSQEISLAGLFLVYIPQQINKLSLSRQIKKEEDRERLLRTFEKADIKGSLIVRTLAKAQKEADLLKELEQLKKNWGGLVKKFQEQKGLGQIQAGHDPLLKFLTDALSFDVDRFLVDEKNAYKKIVNWLNLFRLDLAKKVELYKESESLFQKYRLESQVHRANQKKSFIERGGLFDF